GVTDSAVWRWANGQRKPGLNEAYAIERATGGAVPAIYWLAKKSSRAA
ncbi:MAG: putative antitoxin of bacterial toxin-antitoxin system, YdaS/YdaT, partial [Pseudomonadota bacterium]